MGIEDYMYGICLRLAKNKVLKMLKMVLLSSSLFMVDIRPRYLISRGTPMIPGQFVPYQKTILCKFGKWQRIFTTTKKLIHLHLKPIRNVQNDVLCILLGI